MEDAVASVCELIDVTCIVRDVREEPIVGYFPNFLQEPIIQNTHAGLLHFASNYSRIH